MIVASQRSFLAIVRSRERERERETASDGNRKYGREGERERKGIVPMNEPATKATRVPGMVEDEGIA